MNKGLISGTNKPVWTDWFPQLICVGDGGEVQPVNDGTELRNLGRYTFISPTTILAEFHLSYSYWIERGTGKAYGVQLPVPAKRWYGDKNSTNHPLIGRGYALRALANPAPVFPLVSTLMETTWTSGKHKEEYNNYCHVWLEKMIDWQSGTWNANTQTKTISHLLDYTPNELDVEMVLTSVSDAYNNTPIIVDNATSTTIDFHYPNAAAVYTNLCGQCGTGITTSANRFLPLNNAVAAWATSVTGAGAYSVVPGNSQTYTIDNLYVEQDTGDASFTRTYTVQKNGSDTALTCTVGTSATTANDTSHSFTVTSGDQISIKTSASGTTASTGAIRWTVRGTATTNKNMSLLGGTASTVSNSVNTYIATQGYGQSASTVDVEQNLPNAGTIQNAQCILSAAPGAGTSYAFTLVKNTSDTAITFTISGTNTTGSDTTHTVSYSQGDKIYWKCVPTGTPTARAVFISLETVPTVPGESVHMFASTSAVTNSADRYESLNHQASGATGTTEASRSVLSQAATFQKLAIYNSVLPAAGKTVQVSMSTEGSTASTPTATITNSNQSATDNSTTKAVSVGDTVAFLSHPSGTPATFQGEYSIVSNITSYTLPSANVTYKYRGNGWANSSGGLSSQLVNPKHPWPWNIVEGLFMHLIYEADV